MGIDGSGKYNEIVPYVDVWNTTNTSGENNYDHSRSSFFSTMPTYRTLSTSCECALMAIHGPEQQSTINYDVHVCERDSFGMGSWLGRKSSMLLMHERLTITEKGWRGIYFRGEQ
jgi:hypothetical protein